MFWKPLLRFEKFPRFGKDAGVPLFDAAGVFAADGSLRRPETR
jgi:hypothetical protein